VHPVLNCEHGLLDAGGKHTLKETSAVASLMAIFREHSCWELVVVTDQNNFFRLVHERDQVSEFD